jgi:NAD(P)-dependent dehydrogenase (short-subunit alcohol dehydrogenase family)
MSEVLTGRIVIVTGASSGIGRGIALRFAQAGARVLVADLSQDSREGAAQPTVDAIRAAGGDAEFVRCDVTRPADIAAAVQRAEELGGLDAMVNNAGILGPGDFLNVSEEELDRLLAVNVKGVFFGCQAAARVMIPRCKGAIVNLSSIGGIHAVPRFAAYSGSKGFVRLLTYSLGQLLAPHGIRVNAIHPGVIDTQMNRIDSGSVTADGQPSQPVPLGRSGLPTEIGDAAVFLASDQAAYINATSLVVDGGRLAS